MDICFAEMMKWQQSNNLKIEPFGGLSVLGHCTINPDW
jgi:hypothetical protein